MFGTLYLKLTVIRQIDGDVYDVSKGKAYQPGAAYHHLWVPTSFVVTSLFMNCSVGVDAARAFGTGCFKTHRTHDLRGLSEAELSVGENLAAEWGLCFTHPRYSGSPALETILRKSQGLR